MEVNFKHQNPAKPDPIYIEQVFAEKPGGGVIDKPSFDAPPTTAVGKNEGGKLVLIKAARLVKVANTSDTTIEVAKGHGFVKNDFIGNGTKSVQITAIDTTTHPDKDLFTIAQFGKTVPVGTVLYQAKSAQAEAIDLIETPLFVTGSAIKGGEGDQTVRLINGANLRKETANIASEVAALLPMIQLV